MVAGKRPAKISTDKVNLALITKNFFFWKIARQAVVHRFRKNIFAPSGIHRQAMF